MRFQASLVKILGSLTLIAGLVHGSPFPNGTANATVACDPISKYTTSYFLANICKRPPTSTCLFYTRGLSKRARDYSTADGNDLTTIWAMWPRSYYNLKQVKSNPLRCIVQNRDDRATYFENMSRSMAITCDIFATVMDPNPQHPRSDGIWGRVEFPQLTGSFSEGTVYSIDGINADATESYTIWTRQSGGKRDEIGVESGGFAFLTKRDECGIDGDDVAGEFDEGGEYPVDW